MLPAALVVAASAAVVLARPEHGIAFALVLAPLFNLAVGPTSVKPLIYLLGFGVLAYGLLVSSVRGQPAPRSLTLGVLAFFLAGVAASAAGIDPARSLGRVVMLAAALALYFAVLAICKERPQLLVVAAGAIGGLAVAGAHGTAQRLLGREAEYSISAGGDIVDRVQGAFGHPNELGGFIAVLVPLALVFAVSRRLPTRLRLLGAFALVVAVPALFYTFSRGPVAALAAGLLVGVAAMRPRLAIPTATLVVAGAFFLLPAALEERFERTSTSSVTVRSDIWRAALTIYSERPILGVGLNNFSEAYAELPTELPGAVQRRLLHTSDVLVPPYAENVYLNVLAEEGVLGLGALAILLVAALVTVYRGSRVRDPVGRAVSLGVGAGVVTLVFHGVVQVTLFTETVFPLVALLAVVGRYVTLDWVESEPDEPGDVSDTRPAS